MEELPLADAVDDIVSMGQAVLQSLALGAQHQTSRAAIHHHHAQSLQLPNQLQWPPKRELETKT